MLDRLAHGPVVAGLVPDPYTGRDSGVAPVLSGPYVGQDGVQAGVAGSFPEKKSSDSPQT
jgi:hypothetical protein